ncbi:hypothetical protein VTL71DRAFT_1247 [Oculimacula yallundae]|uniref:Uncharacterized protein n=1 Tax=Oculimacula yallundae TaxID=86028 RepID=A0ABR4CA52_9HELO
MDEYSSIDAEETHDVEVTKALSKTRAESAATATARGKRPLDLDIWFLIFDELRKDNTSRKFGEPNLEFQQWLRATRLVSRDFDTIVTQLVYRKFGCRDEVLIRDLINAVDGISLVVKTQGKVIKHTTQLQLPKYGERRLVEKIAMFLPSMEMLGLIWWRKIKSEDTTVLNLCAYANSMYLEAFMQGGSRSRFIEDNNFCIIDDSLNDSESNHLMDRKRTTNTPQTMVLKNAVQKNVSTEEGCSFAPIRNILPALDSLVLYNRDIGLAKSADDVLALWNLRNLRKLAFYWSDAGLLLRMVPNGDLAMLQSLIIYSKETDEDEATLKGLLYQAFRGMKSLKSLYIRHKQWKEIFSIENLRFPGASLTSLNLHGRRSGEEEPELRLLNAKYMYCIRDHCPNLKALSLDIDFTLADVSFDWLQAHLVELGINSWQYESTEVVAALSRYHSLTILDIWSCLSLVRKGATVHGTDPEYDAGCAISDKLLSAKLGENFSWLALHMDRRSGGDRPHWAALDEGVVWPPFDARMLVSRDGSWEFGIEWENQSPSLVLSAACHDNSNEEDNAMSQLKA